MPAQDKGFIRDQINWHDSLVQKAIHARNIWQQIVDYEFPSHKDVTRTREPNSKKGQFVFDSTAVDGIFTSASFVQGTIFNQASRWFGLKHRLEDLNRKQAVAGYLNNRRNVQLLAYKQANFYAASFEWVQDWIAFGNSPMLIDETPAKNDGKKRIVFTTFPAGSYVWSEGDEGWIDKIWRIVDYEAIQCVQRWGEDAVGPKIKKLAQTNPFETVKLLHCIYPRKIFDTLFANMIPADKKPWGSDWIDYENKYHIANSGYDEWPVACARWAVTAGEPYARGLGELALPDSQTLNKAEERTLLEWDKSIDPPTLEKAGNVVSGVLSHRPGSRNVVKDINGFRLMDSELRAGNRLHEINLERKQKSIRQVFFIDEIKQLIAVEGPNPQKTAFEVSQRLKLLYQILGPVSGRFESEGQKTNIHRTGAILERQGLFGKVPPELEAAKKFGFDKFDIEYDSPLSRAQRDDEALSIQQYTGSDIPLLMQIDPTVKNIPNATMMARQLAEIRGVHFLLRDQEEADKISDLEAKVISLQQALAAAEQAATAVGKLGPVLPSITGGQNGVAQAA